MKFQAKFPPPCALTLFHFFLSGLAGTCWPRPRDSEHNEGRENDPAPHLLSVAVASTPLQAGPTSLAHKVPMEASFSSFLIHAPLSWFSTISCLFFHPPFLIMSFLRPESTTAYQTPPLPPHCVHHLVASRCRPV